MILRYRYIFVCALFLVGQILPAGSVETRQFEFDYRVKVTEIPEAAKKLDLWIPIPSTDANQTIRIIPESVGEKASISVEPAHGNRILHRQFELPYPGLIGVNLRFEVTRHEVIVPEAKTLSPTQKAPIDIAVRRYLAPDAMIPHGGKLAGIAHSLGLPSDDPMKSARGIYDHVVDTMMYDKSRPGWGRGDALWACDARFGNCSDFHSVFIGLAREVEIPSYFEIGFPLPSDATSGEIGGYHCWAWFHVPNVGWVPVDASEADKHPDLKEYYFGALTKDRVGFSKGRDLILEPPQQGPPLNFFIYPYIEIDGEPHDGFEKSFSFRDLN